MRRDGVRYALELRGVPIEHRGEPHVLYMGRDITAARRVQAALRDSEEQYRAIFNASADGLVLRDKRYRAVDVNPAYLAITGYTRDEVLAADRVLAQRDEAIQARHRAQHDRIIAGDSVRFDAIGTRKDGSKFEVEVSAMPLLYRGEPHVLYAARDISERRQAEARRTELELQLRQAQKMEAVGHLTGGIAHDFNNILTGVIGYLVLGLERAELLNDATLQRQLGRAHHAAQRARELIAQMLAFARHQRGERRVLALEPLVRQSLQLLRATLPSSAVVDFVAIEPELMRSSIGCSSSRCCSTCASMRAMRSAGPGSSGSGSARGAGRGIAPHAAPRATRRRGSSSAWPTAAPASRPTCSIASSSRS